MRLSNVFVALTLSAASATPAFALNVTEQQGSGYATADLSSTASSGTIVAHYRGSAGSNVITTTFTGSAGPAAVVSSVQLVTVASGCIASITLFHQPTVPLAVPLQSAFSFTGQILTFPFAGSTVNGTWNTAVLPTVAGCVASFDINLNWSLPTQTPPPPPSLPDPAVQGFKLDAYGNRVSNQTILVDGNSTGTGNPYATQMSANTFHTFTAVVPAGWSVQSSYCHGCIDHPDSIWVFQNNIVAQAPPGGYIDLWWKFFSAPMYFLDTPTSDDGSFGGWAYDPNSSSTSIDVDVYVDGPAGSGAPGYRLLANGSRPDVDAAFGITGDHGFTFTLPAQFFDGRNHVIYAYAISLFQQPNPLIGKGSYTPNPPQCPSNTHDCNGDGTLCRAICP